MATQQLYVYNTLARIKQPFKSIVPDHVGMYVCGPTVYGDGHLGHARPAITFDILFRYLQHIGYKVRYVRNITDVGHLEHDADEGEDKIAKKARLEQKEPMEVVQYYMNRYHKAMEALNVLPPSIEPHASGHIIEQIAYSGRNVNELIDTTRELDGQSEKREACDFALWKKAAPEHIMHWPSPWSEGFPGWHLECSTMSEKYLGEEFDIHGGGLDLLFPHHECEIAQTCAAKGHPTVHYWMHNNMITIDGKKMGKSYGNFITLDEFFNGTHPKLTQPYSPMTIRFFILMAHYRSTVDFSNEALQSAEKGMKRMMEGYASISRMKSSPTSAETAATLKTVEELEEKMYEAMNDDLTTPIVISNLYELVSLINKVIDGHAKIDEAGIQKVQQVFKTFLIDILGMKDENAAGADSAKTEAYKGAVDLLLDVRAKAKASKDWATSDLIRNKMAELGFVVKDTKDGATWTL